MSDPMAVILAAGKSTRMKSALPKVLHQVCGRPMIEYVLDAARSASVTRVVAIIGHRADLVRSGVVEACQDVRICFAGRTKGHRSRPDDVPGTALRSHRWARPGPGGRYSLLKRESLASLLGALMEQKAACVIGTDVTEANFGLGRVIRDAHGQFERIVEEKDATPEEKRVQEINTGCYAFDSQALLASLDQIRPNNSQSEYYLTDCPRVLKDAGANVVALNAFDMIDELGESTRREQLAEVTRTLQKAAMSTLDGRRDDNCRPRADVFIDPQVQIGADTFIEPFTHISGRVVFGDNCHIGPHSVITGPLQIESGSTVGPFQFLSGK